MYCNLSRLPLVGVTGAGLRAMSGQATQTIPPRRRRMVPNKHWNPLFRFYTNNILLLMTSILVFICQEGEGTEVPEDRPGGL